MKIKREMNGTRRLVVYADDVNLLAQNINTTIKGAEIILDT
jgi:hypothetical protein